MKKLAGLAVAGSIVLAVLIYASMAFGFRADCVNAEADIKGRYEANQASYDSMWKKFKEMAQVPDMYTEDLKKVWDGAMQGRYGTEGSKATWQFIQEHNPNVDSALYTQIQRAIEANRNSFNADQVTLVSMKQNYEKIYNGNRSLLVGMWFGFPRIDLAKYAVVTSDETAEAFATKRADQIKLR